jgi:hypothetical protein
MNGLKKSLIFGIIMIAFFTAGCLESPGVNGEKETLSMGAPDKIMRIV